MADVKFSQFSSGGELQSTDILVGLRSGVNTQFTSPSSGGGPFLLKANNLSDVANPDSALVNLGTGSGEDLIIVDSDFVGGVYQLPIPCPFFIIVTTDNPGNQIRLPVANVPGQSFSLGLGPEIRSINSTQSFDVADSTGTSIISMSGFDDIKFPVTNTSTPEGAWNVNTQVFNVNSKIGGITLTGSDISANFTPSNYTPVNSTVTGNLEGIDNYIGSHPQVVRSWNGLTTPVDVTAGPGIDITSGVISLTGTGATAAYGGTITNNNNFSNSFTDATTWKGIRVDNLLGVHVDFITTLDGSNQLYFQYTGTESSEFRIGLVNRIRTVSNASVNSYNYSLGIDSGSGIVPIYSATALMPFVTQGNTDLDAILVPYSVTVMLNPNDKLYPIIQNRGDINPTNNEYIVRYLLSDIQKIGDVGGTASGVVSLNGLTGILNLTSTGSSLTITPSGTSVNLDLTVPVVIANGGTNATGQVSSGINFFDGTKITSNANLTYDGTNNLSVTNTSVSTALRLVSSGSSNNEQIFFTNFAGGSWSIGQINTDSSFRIIAPPGGGTPFSISGGGVINLSNLTASTILSLDSSKNIITTALSGDISSSGLVTTLATVNSNVGSFGSATQVGTFTANAKGLITACSNVTISGVSPGGSAGGDLSGTYPNPTVANINTVALGSTTATAGNLLIGSGTQWVTQAMSGDATITSGGVITIANLAVTNAKIANTTIDLTAKVTGVLPQNNGGSNTTASSYSASAIIFQNASNNAFSSTNNLTYGASGLQVYNSTTISAAGSVSAPTLTTLLNLASSTQNSARIVLSGQEFLQAANSSTDGIAMVIGVNRTGNRQLWIGDSAAFTANSTNVMFRVVPQGISGGVVIDAQSTDGTTQKALQVGGTGAASTLLGSTIGLLNGAVTISPSGSVSAPTATSALNISNTVQSSARITLTGQEFYQSSNTSTDGVALLLGVNRSGNRQMWVADSAALASSGTNKTLRFQPNGGTIDGMATDGVTPVAVSFGQTGAATSIFGQGITLNSNANDVNVSVGNLSISTATKGYQQKSVAVSAGTANGSFVTNVVLTAGASGTINNSFVTTSCVGSASVSTSGGTPGLGYRVICNAGSFTVTSTNALDTSTLNVIFVKGI